MASITSSLSIFVVLAVSFFFFFFFVNIASAIGVFNQEFVVTWAPSKVKILNDGQVLQLSLDRSSGSGFVSKHSYLFGNIDMQIKLVPGDSAGTVTAYYLASQGATRDEIDFEFLGNVSGQPYTLQTNIYSNGVGNREQRIYLWFDPTLDFHTYRVSWNKQRIMFLVDGVPIRVFSNNEALGVPYLKRLPMGVSSSLWNADDWATRGGLVKTNWEHAPFIASYRAYHADACVADSAAFVPTCTASPYSTIAQPSPSPDVLRQKLQWVHSHYIVYDYCTDKTRYPITPVECLHVTF